MVLGGYGIYDVSVCRLHFSREPFISVPHRLRGTLLFRFGFVGLFVPQKLVHHPQANTSAYQWLCVGTDVLAKVHWKQL